MELAIKILLVLFGLYAGVMSWLFKTAYADLQNLKKEVANIKNDTMDSLRRLLDDRFNVFEERLDEKLEAAFTKLECTWMNEGRISPKKKISKEKEG